MDKRKLVVTLLLSFIVLCSSTIAITAAEPNEPNSLPPVPVVAKFKTHCANLINRLHSYFPPPNLDFRGTSDTSDADSSIGGVTGEKVKEAVAKSLEKSKAAVEDSAKSAARLAGDTANNLKQTFSHHTPQPEEL